MPSHAIDLPDERSAGRRWFKWSALTVLAVLATACGVGAFGWHHLHARAREMEETRNAVLVHVVSCQQAFREQDLDRDGIADFAAKRELIRFGLIRDDMAFLTIEPSTTDPTERWYAVALPSHPFQGDALFVNHEGVVISLGSANTPPIDPSTCEPRP